MGIFKNKLFRKLFFASFTSQMGSTIGNMAFAFYLLDHFSKQPYFATLAELMYSLPIVLVFFLVGVAADRFDRKKIAENSDWIRVILTAALFAFIHFHLLILVFAVLFIRSAVSKFFAPAEMSILQGVLDKDQYMQASGLNQTVMGLFMLFGVGLGALSYHYFGVSGSIIIDGISFMVSAILIRSCHISQDVRLPNGKTKVKELNIKLVLTDFKAGLEYILKNKLLLTIISGFLIFGLINGGFSVLPLFTMKYKLAPEHYKQFAAYFSIFLGIGFIIGSSIGSALVEKFKAYRVLISGVLLTGGMCILAGAMTNVWWFYAVILAMGIILAPVNVALSGWMNELVDPKFMGRVSGWLDPLMMTSHSAALAIIAVIFPALIKVDSIYNAIGILMLIVGTYYLIILPRLVRKENKVQIKFEM